MNKKEREQAFADWITKEYMEHFGDLPVEDCEYNLKDMEKAYHAGTNHVTEQMDAILKRMNCKNFEELTMYSVETGALVEREAWQKNVKKLIEKLEQFCNPHNPEEFVKGVKASLVHVRSISKKENNTHATSKSKGAIASPQDPSPVREHEGDRLEELK